MVPVNSLLKNIKPQIDRPIMNSTRKTANYKKNIRIIQRIRIDAKQIQKFSFCIPEAKEGQP